MADLQSIAGEDASAIEPGRPHRFSFVAWVMLAAAVLTVAYWILWYSGGRALLASSQASSYFIFENAFPAADAWLVVTLVLGAIGLFQRRSWGLLWSLLAGGAGIYLGCMDVLFDLENNIYSFQRGADPSAAIIEITINILTFVLSIIILSYVWSHRRWLSESENA